MTNPGMDGPETDVFLTHAWAEDEEKRKNHDRVALINDHLKSKGIRTWFDNDRIQQGPGDIVQMMTRGIDRTKIVVVCITKAYMQKLQKVEDDNCKAEFSYAVNTKGTPAMIAVVMEKSMRNPRAWKGPLSFRLGDHPYIDLTDDPMNIDLLVRALADRGIGAVSSPPPATVPLSHLTLAPTSSSTSSSSSLPSSSSAAVDSAIADMVIKAGPQSPFDPAAVQEKKADPKSGPKSNLLHRPLFLSASLAVLLVLFLFLSPALNGSGIVVDKGNGNRGIVDKENGIVDKGDGSGNDNSGKDNSGKDNSGKDNSGKDNSGKDNSGKDNSGKDSSGFDASNCGKDNSEKDNSGFDASNSCLNPPPTSPNIQKFECSVEMLSTKTHTPDGGVCLTSCASGFFSSTGKPPTATCVKGNWHMTDNCRHCNVEVKWLESPSNPIMCELAECEQTVTVNCINACGVLVDNAECLKALGPHGLPVAGVGYCNAYQKDLFRLDIFRAVPSHTAWECYLKSHLACTGPGTDKTLEGTCFRFMIHQCQSIRRNPGESVQACVARGRINCDSFQVDMPHVIGECNTKSKQYCLMPIRGYSFNACCSMGRMLCDNLEGKGVRDCLCNSMAECTKFHLDNFFLGAGEVPGECESRGKSFCEVEWKNLGGQFNKEICKIIVMKRCLPGGNSLKWHDDL